MEESRDSSIMIAELILKDRCYPLDDKQTGPDKADSYKNFKETPIKQGQVLSEFIEKLSKLKLKQ